MTSVCTPLTITAVTVVTKVAVVVAAAAVAVRAIGKSERSLGWALKQNELSSKNKMRGKVT